jgi:hypothetical protein
VSKTTREGDNFIRSRSFSGNFYQPRRLLVVMSTDELRRRAANCLRWAQEAANERTKALWLNMAQIWLDRADALSAASARAAMRAGR